MTSIVNPESTELVVSDGVHGNGQYGFTYPDAITLTDGNILAYGTSQFGIIARILAPDGTALTGDIQLATSGGYHDVVALPGGGWAMAYEIPGDSTDIAFQIFDPTGQPIGSEIQVTGRQAGYQVDPQVALLADGNIVVSWLSGGSEVGQIYDTAGNTDGSAFTMRADGVEAPDIAATPDGGFVAVWVDHSGTFAPGGGTVIVGERFNADGTPNGGMFQIGQATLYGEMDPSVTVLADGSIAVAFRHAAIANLGHGDVLAVDIWARVIHPDGTTDPIIAVTHPTETDVNHSERGDEYPEIVALPDGGFAIGFTSVNDLGGYGEREYYVATFDADGNRVTGNQLASSDGESLGVFAGITALEDGSVVAVWGNGGAHGRIFGPTDLSDIVINGDGADNALTGSSANETLNGGAGNDQLDGGTGVDLMRGGHGNDSYFVDDSRESVIEDSINGGDDTVTASASWHLAEGLYVEHLVAAPGTAPIYLTGNAYDQSLQGNAGDNILDGGGGDDSFAGGAGNDVYIILGDRNYGVSLPANVVTENANEGTDEVRVRIGNYTLGINVENLTGIGDLAQILTGNELNNVITGGYQDSLNGLAGNDTLVRTDGYGTMAGGTGDDIYILAPWGGGGEQVVENAGEGTDEVRVSEGPYTLAANVENLTGTGSAGQQLTGNELDNRIVGGSGNDNIQGMDGNDFIDGGAGNDSMTGGAGDDTYVVASALDVVVEDVGGGVDTVQAKLSWTLGANLENLTLTGSLALSGTGNALDNVLRGNRGGNTLAGLDGDDTLDGGLGDDVLDGGAGRDAASYASAAMGVTVSLAIGGAQNTVGAGTDTLVGIENLTGSSYADTLTGDGNANLLTGAAGADTLVGGSGNDTLMGGSGADTLRGGVGDDVLAGGAGNDVYYVESAGDSVVENSGEGIDSVHSSIGWTLSANVEELLLTGTADVDGTGNELANTLTGNSGDNALYGLGGNDTLKGGAGDDAMSGGTGNDIYFVDSAGDSVIENAGEGTDTVNSSLSFTLGANVERLVLTGASAIDGTGNELANMLTGNGADNHLYGLAGNDSLQGGGGSDWLEGGTGRDVFLGGAGADQFVFRDGDFGALTSSGCDTVNDFSSAEGDKLDFQFVDADSTSAGDQAFTFLGTSAFDGHAGELRYEVINGNTYVQGDTNGDGHVDFMVRVIGDHAFTSGDFTL